MLRPLLERFERTNRRHALLKKGDALVVGISGGPDSTALLELLCALRRKYALRLTVAHLDHGLQKDSAKALAAARQAAERHGLPFRSEKADVRAHAAKHKLSLEDAGRERRYLFFERVAKKTRSNKIATAHTADDQAETFLMRLVRGSGLRGLAGIPYKRRHGRLEIVRPVLDCSKKELGIFLKKARIFFVQDKTNLDPVFLRNRVRRQLLPLLKRRFNPQIRQALANLQTVCRDAQDYLELQTEKAFRRCLVRADKRKVTLSASRLRGLPPALRYGVLAAAVAKMRGRITGFGHAHWTAVDPLLLSEGEELETHWPHRIRVQKKGGQLVVFLPRPRGSD